MAAYKNDADKVATYIHGLGLALFLCNAGAILNEPPMGLEPFPDHVHSAREASWLILPWPIFCTLNAAIAIAHKSRPSIHSIYFHTYSISVALGLYAQTVIINTQLQLLRTRRKRGDRVKFKEISDVQAYGFFMGIFRIIVAEIAIAQEDTELLSHCTSYDIILAIMILWKAMQCLIICIRLRKASKGPVHSNLLALHVLTLVRSLWTFIFSVLASLSCYSGEAPFVNHEEEPLGSIDLFSATPTLRIFDAVSNNMTMAACMCLIYGLVSSRVGKWWQNLFINTVSLPIDTSPRGQEGLV